MVFITMGNIVWYIVMGLMAALVILLYLILKRKDQEGRQKGLLYCSIGIVLLFYVQRVFLFNYIRYQEVYGTGWPNRIVELLPLQLCNVGFLLAVWGLWKRKYSLLSFCFFVSSLGAVAAIAMPESIYTEANLLEPAVFLFYLFHGLLVAVYLNIGFLGFIEWNWKSGAKAIAILCILTIVMHGVNLIGQAAGATGMNYFYTLYPAGSAALELFWSWIPVPCLYLYPPGIMLIVIWELAMFLLKKILGTVIKLLSNYR